MNKEIIIIGGGIIGLCSAYYLQKEGHKVLIIDQSNLDSGASYVNAGFLSPSHIIPLSAPGVMKQGIKWMFDKSSPLYIKPRFDIDFMKWTLAFNKSCTAKHVKKSIPIIRDITMLSQELYRDIKQDESFQFHYESKGLLMLCQSEKMLEEEIKIADLGRQHGLEASEISIKDLKKLEPNVSINVKGATYYKCDSHMTPQDFMGEMKSYLKGSGVEFLTNEKVNDIEMINGHVTFIKTNRKEYRADEFVLAAGSWSSLLSKKLNLQLLLQAGKGYRINMAQETGISIPAILSEAKVAVTPMNGFTRFAGTMEIAGINHDINEARVEAIANAVTRFYPEITINQKDKNNVQAGLRPVSPDGLPYIGRSKKCFNLTIATGHAMMGWGMGSATGKLVSEVISNKSTSLNIDAFNPDRKF
ncbi:NAD(P)/FAD-dependent oxidoreductase [Gelidibacter sp. F63206]|uniref:NAD(P)/FAD-dependent oxidoreductase n=1 Tax=Gelidibacter sp. F63206 TaxID=2926425 RepID=UPI001FF629EB|nr:FAD-dependent oxidoreductase [Gelidibacter sp. F63206]MCK0115286.1 FAD-dependent oxidoreductase [Gelidibacter sp. F63206]